MEYPNTASLSIFWLVVHLQGWGSLQEGGSSSLGHIFQRKPQAIKQLPSKGHMFRTGRSFFILLFLGLFEISDVLKGAFVWT